MPRRKAARKQRTASHGTRKAKPELPEWMIALAIVALAVLVVISIVMFSPMNLGMQQAQAYCTRAFADSCRAAGELPSVWNSPMTVDGSSQSCGQIITCRCLKEADGSFSSECLPLQT